MPLLNSRSKWQASASKTLDEGDLVWLIEESDKRGHYHLGRVLEVFPGADGVIRSSRVQTKEGVYKRPVVKLAPVLQDSESVFPSMKNRAGDVGAT